ncbi:CheW protein [Chthoniobacter flavus Ellin428]|uniref:CheW protein n=1 Tax=Chthoniobacter flavus Ellin428 TaxID=497964 RepID=B4D1N2_9BACT|nr:chemotaxis protein CheW [Chthoniobacter flavus]EDY19644.1 CheW protein [Chthoniobacter flavus Ellin428]TCO92881.1 chemotaxis-related protein WspB [Chthoniobacter flavus]
MLFILFQLGQDRYALDASNLVEILPLAQVKALPHAPVGIAGIIDYHGVTLPVIDLSDLALGHPSVARISTRILIAEIATGRRFALIAERANRLLQRDATDFVEPEVTVEAAPYLGPITRDDSGIVQWITPQKLFSNAVCDALYQQAREAA